MSELLGDKNETDASVHSKMDISQVVKHSPLGYEGNAGQAMGGSKGNQGHVFGSESRLQGWHLHAACCNDTMC